MARNAGTRRVSAVEPATKPASDAFSDLHGVRLCRDPEPVLRPEEHPSGGSPYSPHTYTESMESRGTNGVRAPENERAALRFARGIISRVSRTFAIGISVLPGELGKA